MMRGNVFVAPLIMALLLCSCVLVFGFPDFTHKWQTLITGWFVIVAAGIAWDAIDKYTEASVKAPLVTRLAQIERELADLRGAEAAISTTRTLLEFWVRFSIEHKQDTNEEFANALRQASPKSPKKMIDTLKYFSQTLEGMTHKKMGKFSQHLRAIGSHANGFIQLMEQSAPAREDQIAYEKFQEKLRQGRLQIASAKTLEAGCTAYQELLGGLIRSRENERTNIKSQMNAL